ncbi:N-alpha-acetyltransferase 16, NatA auxiliary subunit [Orobanche minor]
MEIAEALINAFFPAQIGGHKEMKHLKRVKNSYQVEDFKSAMNGIDKILAVKKDHGETLALKGLMLSRMDRKSEAYDCAHRGFQNNNRSIFCLIILGLICQSDFDYEKAIEFVQNASKISPFNIELSRYLSILQAQMRNLSAYVECRCQILTLEPNICFHHIAYAVSHHINNNCLKAIEILENYEKSHGQISEEMLLYKISLFEESGNFEKALKELLDKKSIIVDDVAFREQHASLLVKLKDLNEAKKIYVELLSQNPENYSYHAGLQKCVATSDNGQYSPNAVQELKDLYKSLGEQHSSSSAVKRIPLDFLQGDEFRKALDIYIRPLLHERVPSVFSDLRSLYEHPDKVDIIDKVILELGSSIRENNESIPTPLWTLCLLAQHYDRRGQYGIALAKVNEAIEQNAAVAELYLVKARILKHTGDLETAAFVAEKAKDMDPKSSFTKKKYVKRMLQVDKDVVFTGDGGDQKNSSRNKARILKHTGDPETAAFMEEKTKDMDPKNSFTKKKNVKRMPLVDKDVVFTKDGEDQPNSYGNMGCMWYELACGDCYYRRGDLGSSLKNYLAVLKYYTELSEEHFDFRSYRSGKMTLRASVESLRYQEQLDPGSYFHKAATGIIRCYMKLYDSSTKLDDDPLMSEMGMMFLSEKEMQETTASRVPNTKYLRNTQSRKKVKSHAKELCNKVKETSRASKSSDPIGAKYLKVENPLLEATKYLNLLCKSPSDSFGTYFLLFELSMRKHDMLEAYRASNDLVRLERDNPDTLRCLVRFFGRLDSMVLEESVRTALAVPLSTLHEESLIKLIRDFLQRNKDSVTHAVAAAEMWFFLQPYKKFLILKLIEATINSAQDMKLLSLSNCIGVHKLLNLVFGDSETTSRWTKDCKDLFPFPSFFSTLTSDGTSKANEGGAWTFDSGSSLHCTNNASLLLEKHDHPGAAFASSGNIVQYTIAGNVLIHSKDCGRYYLLEKVVHLPKGSNIISVEKFVRQESCLAQFFYDGFLLRDSRYISMVSQEYILATGPMLKRRYKFVSKLPGEKEEDSGWYLDSGAVCHTTSDESLLLSCTIEDCEARSFIGVDGVSRSFPKKGSCELTYSSEFGVTRKFVLKDVYVCPQGSSLLSVSAFTRDNECSVLFTPDQYYILDAKDDMLLKPELIRGYGLVVRGEYCLR